MKQGSFQYNCYDIQGTEFFQNQVSLGTTDKEG